VHPKPAPRPLEGQYLLTGPVEPINDTYDIARIAGILQAQALLRQCDPRTINGGTGVEATTRQLAETVASIAGFEGELAWDRSKPDGTPRKLMDMSRLRALDWIPAVDLDDEMCQTYAWFQGRELQPAGA
jgi:nucleoside-diphosphate-sugar epimerase